MKICPTCSRKYEDETMQFCLDDGSRLAAGEDPQATWHLAQPPIVEPRRNPVPPTAPSPPATITARPEHFQALPRPAAPPPTYEEGRPRSGALPWILGIVVVLGISGVLIAWLVTRGGSRQVAVIYPSPTPTVEVTRTPDLKGTPERATPTPVARPTANDNRQPKPTVEPTAPPKRPLFSILNNTSYSGGSRITYYPRASVGQCQADCTANASCRAFTWIRAGAYNPGDSAMCYLMYSVSGPVSHPCCISGVKN